MGGDGRRSGAPPASLGFVGHAAMQTGAKACASRERRRPSLDDGRVDRRPCSVRDVLLADGRDDLRERRGAGDDGLSFWGQFIVVAIVLTGVVSIALRRVTPDPADDADRALLIAKLVIVVIIISLALFNRFVLLRGSKRV